MSQHCDFVVTCDASHLVELSASTSSSSHRPCPSRSQSGKYPRIILLKPHNSCYRRSQAVSAEGPVEFSPRADLHVKNVTLGVDLEDENGRSTLKLVYLGPPVDGDSDEEDEDKEDGVPELVETVLCSLTPGKVRDHSTFHATLAQLFAVD